MLRICLIFLQIFFRKVFYVLTFNPFDPDSHQDSDPHPDSDPDPNPNGVFCRPGSGSTLQQMWIRNTEKNYFNFIIKKTVNSIFSISKSPPKTGRLFLRNPATFNFMFLFDCRLKEIVLARGKRFNTKKLTLAKGTPLPYVLRKNIFSIQLYTVFL